MIDFNMVPKVAYDEMNQVHEEEVHMLNRLEELLNNGSDETIDELCIHLLDHTVDHFNNEQRLMLEVGFPAYMMHKGEHDRVLDEMQTVQAHWRSKRDREALREYYFQVIPQWLMQHISTMDTMTAQFICMRKGC